MVNDKILLAREARREKIKILSQDSDVVCIKANVPGWDKNIAQANAVVYFFTREVEKLGGYDFNFIFSEDGLYVLCRINDGASLKKKAVKLEENHFLGRLVDIDVFLKGAEKSLSRTQLRKCFLCDLPAFVCGREKRHNIGELLDFFIENSQEYFSSVISEIIEISMKAELNIENKFGLVTPTSCGSHTDLNYGVMIEAISAIKRPLSKAFALGLTLDISSRLIEKLKEVGVECENLMFKATKGANAYKGFIFVGGVLLATVGALIKNGLSIEQFSKVCGEICKKFVFPNDTFGATAYKNGFGGIRESAINGFPILQKAEALINTKPLEQVLSYIVGNISDSVLLKRANSLDKYNYFKKLISEVGENDCEREKITKKCIENNISVGGSADLLISAVMLRELRKIFYL